MREAVKLTGMIIRSAPVGEADKRLVILSRERGKITAFARGAKRSGSMLMAASRPFSFGVFTLYEGRDAYNLQSAEISNYFAELSSDMEGACYGFYFLEFADYYTRENMDETNMLKLLYQSLRALSRQSIPNPLILRIFELKAMVFNGEYTMDPPRKVCDSAVYTWEYVITSPVETLYQFTVTDEVLNQFKECVELNKKKHIDKSFHSLDILKLLAET